MLLLEVAPGVLKVKEQVLSYFNFSQVVCGGKMIDITFSITTGFDLAINHVEFCSILLSQDIITCT